MLVDRRCDSFDTQGFVFYRLCIFKLNGLLGSMVLQVDWSQIQTGIKRHFNFQRDVLAVRCRLRPQQKEYTALRNLVRQSLGPVIPETNGFRSEKTPDVQSLEGGAEFLRNRFIIRRIREEYL